MVDHLEVGAAHNKACRLEITMGRCQDRVFQVEPSYASPLCKCLLVFSDDMGFSEVDNPGGCCVVLEEVFLGVLDIVMEVVEVYSETSG